MSELEIPKLIVPGREPAKIPKQRKLRTRISPNRMCPVCEGHQYLPRYVQIFPRRSWIKIPCAGCHGLGRI